MKKENLNLNETPADEKPVLADSKIAVGDKVRVEKGNRYAYTVQHIIGKVVWFEETNDNCFLEECIKIG